MVVVAAYCFLSLQEEEGICTHKLFSEYGLIKLLEQAAPLFREVTGRDEMSITKLSPSYLPSLPPSLYLSFSLSLPRSQTHTHTVPIV